MRDAGRGLGDIDGPGDATAGRRIAATAVAGPVEMAAAVGIALRALGLAGLALDKK